MGHEAIAVLIYVPIFSIGLAVGPLRTDIRYSLSKLLTKKELPQTVVMGANQQARQKLFGDCVGVWYAK